jgi:hypothetical protein
MRFRLEFVIASLIFCLVVGCSSEKNQKTTGEIQWPDTIPWWKANNLRMIQTNLPAYEAELNVDSLVSDLKYFSANTLLINAGGIMAFYPTKLEFQYVNPYMKDNMLKDVIDKCHAAGIRVMVRFDFSRAHKSIFDKHPDWFYLSPQGERIINDDMYVVSINAPYEQEQLFNIVGEVIERYPVDGIFLNMPGYQTRNAYVGKYHGIDQNEYEKKRFAEFSHGLKLPVEENQDDPVFKKYQEFKEVTTTDLMERLHKLVKGKNKNIAICTYSEKFVDIIRHESQTNSLPYWPYNASDNVNNTATSYPDHIVSNASIQQISFQSRYNAIEPEEIAIRLYENIANGSGLDISLMGDFQNYEDERNYEAIRKIYAHHKKYERYYGRYKTTAKVVVISPGTWPGGEAGHEYRGVQLMLKEAHIQFDIIEDSQIANRADALKEYKVVILPGISRLDSSAIETLNSILKQGTNIIATNISFADNPTALAEFFGAKAIQPVHDGEGFYLNPDNKELFKSFDQQTLLFWKFNLGLYDFSAADTAFLPILTPGRPGPPEIIGGHEATGHYGMGVKVHGLNKAILLPMNLGRLYFIHGYEQHKNILLDAIEYAYPEVGQLVQTNARPRVEVILQQFSENKPENLNSSSTDGMILHLVNLTGFSGNTYFDPLPVSNISFNIKADFKPSRIFSLASEKTLDFKWNDGSITLSIERLEQYEGLVIEK